MKPLARTPTESETTAPDPLLAEVETLRARVAELEKKLDRRAARQRARSERDQLFRTFLENVNEVIWMQEAGSHRVVYVSPAFERIWGHSSAALYRNPKLWIECIREEERSRVAESFERMFENAMYAEEFCIVRPDGTTRWIWDRGFPICDSDGTVRYVIGIAEDISERRIAERAVHRAERLASIGTLAAGIAHEINNPIGAILLAAEFAQETRELPERVRSALADIAQQASLCGRIVTSVLQFAREEASDKSHCELNQLVREAVDSLALQPNPGDTRRVALRTELTDRPTYLRGNSTELIRLVINLIENARAAGASSVTVRTDREQDETLLLEVADDGSGIEEDTLKRIFDPFFSTRRDEGGSGLGLSIAHRIAQDHHGRITVQSEVGKGSVFSVHLRPETERMQHRGATENDESTGRR